MGRVSHFSRLRAARFPREITTDAAADHLNFAALCDAIDDWNEATPWPWNCLTPKALHT